MYHSITTSILKVVTQYQSPDLDGYFIAKIIVTGFSKEEKIGLEKRIATPQTSVITIFDTLKTGQQLQVILMKTSAQNVNKAKADLQFDLYAYKMIEFNALEVSSFINFSGDSNSIHTGDEAVVPGILILNKILQNTDLVFDQFEIKYSNPLFVNERVITIENNGNIIGLNEKYRKVFELKTTAENK